ncbi:PD-(D/E)XK nuclease family protein [Thermosulfurimonas sp. F29]|uniref:PD-(D/E)XK nuclease family protein n=1 Tax=Thermosulfurimonas sp. F29 TaxID=2867247 RepID=UPI001C82F9B5|nr:DUF3782 domain-containing protein [Thermosulfurimonas sp. F29]MBX6423556.1 DUF3782 domain-containing protein [Thermosulfurimonas sp. F29]
MRDILPRILREHPEVRFEIEKILRETALPRDEAESRFEKLLKEIRDIREETRRIWKYLQEREDRWEEKLEAQNRAWEKRFQEQQKAWERKFQEEQKAWERKFQEEQKAWERKFQEEQKAWEKRFQEQQKLWEKKFEEEQRAWRQQLEEYNRRWDERFKEFWNRVERTLGGLGARWGLQSEEAFRAGMQKVLQSLTNYRVSRYLAYDEKGEVFGHPDQVELDVVIRNGEVWVIEIKSSVSKADLYAFERKVRFYEKREGRRVDRKIIVSPMVDPRALPLLPTLGIEVVPDAADLGEIKE